MVILLFVLWLLLGCDITHIILTLADAERVLIQLNLVPIIFLRDDCQKCSVIVAARGVVVVGSDNYFLFPSFYITNYTFIAE